MEWHQKCTEGAGIFTHRNKFKPSLSSCIHRVNGDQVQTDNFHYPPSGNSVSLFLPTCLASEEAHEDTPGLWLLPSSKEATRTPTLWCQRSPRIKHQWNAPDCSSSSGTFRAEGWGLPPQPGSTKDSFSALDVNGSQVGQTRFLFLSGSNKIVSSLTSDRTVSEEVN